MGLQQPVPAQPGPVVNVIAAVLILLSAIPSHLVQRLSDSTEAMIGAR